MDRKSQALLPALVLASACYSPNDLVTAGANDATSSGAEGTSLDPTNLDSTSAAATGGETGMSESEAGTTEDQAVCGNGELEGQEICDDGVNDGSYGGCESDCLSKGPHCGDDAVQADETCDDGDAENGDGCNVDCRPSAELLWARTIDGDHPTDIAVDAQGGIALVSLFASVRHYDSDGRPEWAENISVANATEPRGSSITYHPSEGWIAGGEAETVAQGKNIWWRRLADDGSLGGAGSYDNTLHTDDTLGGIVFDNSGSFAIAGRALTPDSGDIWLRRFNARGNLLWSQAFDGGGLDAANAVATDPDGHIIVAGSTEVEGEGTNAWIRKYDPEGMTVWTRTYAGDGAATDVISSLAVGEDGTIAAAGESQGDVWLRVYSPGGIEMWTHEYDSPASKSGLLNDSAFDVVIDSAGAVVMCGVQFEATSDVGAWVRKLSADGDVLWTVLPVENEEQTFQFATAVAIDSDDFVFVAGATALEGNEFQGWLHKYSP